MAVDEPTNSSAVRPILEPAREGKKRIRKVIRIWNIEKEKGNKKLEVNVRKQQKLRVIEGVMLGVITGDHE